MDPFDTPPTAFEPRDPAYEAKLRASFERQRIMALLGARLVHVAPGLVRIALPFREELTQQHGFFHAGATTTIADSAGGYASYSLMAEGSSILSVEFKLNFVAPARGELLVAEGRVLKPGRSLFVCQLEVRAVQGGEARTCALGLQTNMRMEFGPDGPPPG